MGDSRKYMIRFIAVIVSLITLFCPIIEAQAGSIFDFFRRDKEKASGKERRKEEVLSLPQAYIVKEEVLSLPRVYIVKEGDSLSTIARRFYGEVSNWTLIYEANKDKINDPNRIERGIELTIPAPETEEVEAFRIELLYQQAKENFVQEEYPAAIVKFAEVIELEKGLYHIYTASAREYIRQAREEIKEREAREARAQRQAEEKRKREQEEFVKRAEEERLRREVEKRKKLAQAELAYKEAEESFLEAKAKFEKAADLEKEAKDDARASQVKAYYQQAKENFVQEEYPAAIVKFAEVIELEKGLYHIYTASAREYIRQAREEIKEREAREARAQRQAEEKRKREQEEFVKRAEEERLRREVEKRKKLAQAELAYKEAEESFLEAKAKFEKAADLEKDIEAASAAKVVEERGDYLARKGEKAQLNLSPKSKSKDKEAIVNNKIETPGVFEYTIGEGDTLYVCIWQEENLNREVIVRPDGKISFSLAGDVPAAGLTFDQLKEELTQRLKEYIKYPVVSLSLKQLGGKKVIILGEVGSPGVYSVTGKSTVLEAISKAGGFTPDAVSASTILIKGGLQNPQGIRLNLKRAVTKADMSQNVILQSEDIIYVPKKFIANLNYTLSQILGPITQGAGASRNLQDW